MQTTQRDDSADELLRKAEAVLKYAAGIRDTSARLILEEIAREYEQRAKRLSDDRRAAAGSV